MAPGCANRALLLLLAASGLGRPGAVPRRSAAADPDTTAGPVASVSAPDVGAPASDRAVVLARVALLGLDAEHISYTPEGVELMLSDGADATGVVHLRNEVPSLR
jgi:hypothetical protein